MTPNGPAQDSSISALPAATKARLRSTQILTSIPKLISELVQNSLDAGAHHIDVSVDPEEWECWVRDDGSGISRDGLATLGGSSVNGMRYATSKVFAQSSLDTPNTFGFRGEALASVADICCLEISSRTVHSAESWSMILKGGKSLYAGPSIRWRRATPGTVVSVRDIFYNLPIRRRSHPSHTRTLELVKREMEMFALVFPHVSFSLENSHKAKDSSQTKTKTRILTIPKTNSTLAAFRHVYGRAFAEHVEELHEISGDMKLDGFLSLDGANSKAYQFLYVNSHPVESGDLHRCVDVIFGRSSFGKHAYDEAGATSRPQPSPRRSPRKTEKKPIYVINLTVPTPLVDNCFEPSKSTIQLHNLQSATAFLSAVVESFLVRNGFLTQRTSQSKTEPGTPRKKRKLTVLGSPTDRLTRPASQPTLLAVRQQAYARDESAPALAPLPSIPEDDLVVGESQDKPDIVWKDPTTGEVFVIDARTGNSYPQHAQGVAEPSAENTASSSRRSLAIRDPAKACDPPRWIAEALRANDAYKLAERRIPALASLPISVHRSGAHDRRSQCAHTSRPTAADPPPPAAWDAAQTGRFTAADLRAARVLGQVDRKFVACVLGGPGGRGAGGRTLVLVDQHAADERVRVERLLRDVCEGFLRAARAPSDSPSPSPSGSGSEAAPGARDRSTLAGGGVRVRALEPAARVLLARAEAERVHASSAVRGAFARWGVAFAELGVPGTRAGADAAGAGDDVTAYVQVEVAAVPEVVADKLLVGDELRDLVKGYLARLDAEDAEGVLLAGQNDECEGDDVMGWQKALRWCPQELVELINSKACRGAIMFNDTLTLEQCKGLILRLSETALPFQCAHGRPSLVPLVDMGETDSAQTPHWRPRVDWSDFLGPSDASRGR